jgi:hypothetical protein
LSANQSQTVHDGVSVRAGAGSLQSECEFQWRRGETNVSVSGSATNAPVSPRNSGGRPGEHLRMGTVFEWEEHDETIFTVQKRGWRDIERKQQAWERPSASFSGGSYSFGKQSKPDGHDGIQSLPWRAITLRV